MKYIKDDIHILLQMLWKWDVLKVILNKRILGEKWCDWYKKENQNLEISQRSRKSRQ